MDQVRAIMRVIWQQRFWVLSGLGVIIAAVCWMLAARRLDTEFVANKGVIEGKFNDLKAIISKPYAGNPAVNERELKETIIIRDNVRRVWQTLYDKQSEGVLKWPAVLGPQFLAEVEGKRFRDPINSVDLRELYRNFAIDRFPALVDIVKAKKMALDATTGSFGDEGGPAGGVRDDGDGGPAGVQFDPQTGEPIEQEKYLVQWLDQPLLRQQLDFKQRPSSSQIWVTQEDLWVYETLLHAIANTNEARGGHPARIMRPSGSS